MQFVHERVLNTTVWCQFGMLSWLGSLCKKPLEKKQNGINLLCAEVYRGSTDSQSVGVVSVQLDAYLKIHHKGLTLMFPSSYWSLFLVMPKDQGEESRKAQQQKEVSQKRTKYVEAGWRTYFTISVSRAVPFSSVSQHSVSRGHTYAQLTSANTKGLPSAKVIVRKYYVFSERLVCTKEGRMLPRSLTNDWVKLIPWVP